MVVGVMGLGAMLISNFFQHVQNPSQALASLIVKDTKNQLKLLAVAVARRKLKILTHTK